MREDGDSADEHEPPPLIGVIGLLAGVALLAVLVLTIEPLRTGIGDAVSGDTGKLREDLRGLGAGGVVITLILALAHVVIWYPTEILNTAAGYVYGFWGGLLIVSIGWLGNGLLAYWAGKHAARPVLYRFIGRHRFDRLERLVESGGVTLLLGMRLVPVVPFSFFSIVAGAAHAPLGTYTWTTVVGYLPLTAVFVYLGTRLESLSPTDPILLIIAAVLIVGLYIGHRFQRRMNSQPESDT